MRGLNKYHYLGLMLSAVLGFLIHPFVVNGIHFPDLGLLAWVYLVPLILSLQSISFKKKFVLCFIVSFFIQWGLVYWLIIAMNGFGGLSVFEATCVLIAFAVVFGALLAIFISGSLEISRKLSLPMALVLPVFMVGHDWLLHFFPFGGYPWGIVPYSQGKWIAYLQWVDHTGIFGLSFFIYFINGLVSDLLISLKEKLRQRSVIYLALLVLAASLSLYLSQLSLENYEKNKISVGQIRLALVQGNVSQDVKWDPRKAKMNILRYVGLSQSAIADGASLLLWPETAYTYGFNQEDLNIEKFLPDQSLGTSILFGSFVQAGKEKNLYNSIIQANAQGEMIAQYSKMHLVPFGEYLPFARYLSFMESLSQGIGNFHPGSDYVLFNVDGFKLAPLICIEDIFPEYAREFSRRGADLLVNFTNDAWYGDSSAQYQHVVYSQFRALENRLPLVRATNTGITAVIDSTGKIVQTLTPFRSSFLLVNVELEKGISFYSQHGNVWLIFPFLFFGLFLTRACVGFGKNS
jgi:apolipoprotein N-acyltransferase